jgi:predicted extracellular nuclease
MLVRIEDPLTVSQNYFHGRYGQVTLSAGGRMYVPLNGIDPINALTGGGMADLVARVPAASRYSYIVDGEAGYLDHALATGPLARQVAGETV